MKTDVSYESYTKFITSFGTLLILASFSIMIYTTIQGIFNWFLTIEAMLFSISGIIFIIIGILRLEKLEIAEVRYKQEKTIREILEQDYLLGKIKLEYGEINKAIAEDNKKLPDNLKRGYQQPRGMESIVGQALNPSFYENLLGQKKKSFWKKIFSRN